jgi:glycosyltransferase involved in cell wall biosynthesis
MPDRTLDGTALAHHWLVTMRGGEHVLEQLSRLFPNAPIHSLVTDRDRLSPWLRERELRASWMQQVPGAARHYRKMLPFFPSAVRSLRVSPETRLVVSSDASVIKGLPVPEGVPHVCYCHSPPRYLWDMTDEYADRNAELNGASRWLFRKVVPHVREFDRQAAQKVTAFIANSVFVQERIRRCYGRDSAVVHPPVDTGLFSPSGHAPGDFYLVVSQLVPYKRIDLAVEAFRSLPHRLVIIGDGPEREKLARFAPDNVSFLGPQPLRVLQEAYASCRAFIFSGIEDFGITPLEAMASGRPVIAYGKGGALETVVEGQSGWFFHEQTAEALAEAIRKHDGACLRHDPAMSVARAGVFGQSEFQRKLKEALQPWAG